MNENISRLKKSPSRMPATVSLASEKERRELLEMHNFTSEFPSTSTFDLRDFTDKDSFLFLVRDRKNNVVAIANIIVKANTGALTIISVRRGYESQGIGKKLIGFIRGWAVKKNISEITLSADKKNYPFYEKTGFKKKFLRMDKADSFNIFSWVVNPKQKSQPVEASDISKRREQRTINMQSKIFNAARAIFSKKSLGKYSGFTLKFPFFKRHK